MTIGATPHPGREAATSAGSATALREGSIKRDRAYAATLLDAVRQRRIDVIVVYKVDRLPCSLADFVKLVELFDAHDGSFIPVSAFRLSRKYPLPETRTNREAAKIKNTGETAVRQNAPLQPRICRGFHKKTQSATEVEGWLVAHAVLRNQSPLGEFPGNRENGNLSFLGHFRENCRRKRTHFQSVTTEFPKIGTGK